MIEMEGRSRSDTYDPPSSYSPEPEFLPPPPRAVPESLGRGPHARGRRNAAIGFAVLGLACLLLYDAPGVDRVAQYFLPLAYLRWIGLASLGLGLWTWVALTRRTGPFRYVREGLPLAVRVLGLQKAPSVVVNGAPTHHAFVARVLFPDPDSGELVQMDVQSNNFSSDRMDLYECRFRVGDYVTAVYMPGAIEKTLRIYAFLELSPERNITRDPAAAAASAWKTLGPVALVVGLLAVLIGNVYFFARYHPLDFEYQRALVPMIVGGLVLGGGLLAGVYGSHLRERVRVAARAREAAGSGRAIEVGTPLLGGGVQAWMLGTLLVLGAPLLGALTALCWCFAANALLDTSPPRHEHATITGLTITTHAFVLREYSLEYTLGDSETRHTLLTTPEHLDTLSGDRGEALVRAGWFAWPWVETVVAALDAGSE
jgi:hypothetical protein